MTTAAPTEGFGAGKVFGVAARPTILFVVAYALNTTPHEAVHACTAYVLGFNSTIYPMWVNPDAASATAAQLATVAAAGPFFSLCAGAACLLVYFAWFRLKPSGLLFLLLAFVGILCFLGPLAGAPFGGDFHSVFTFIEMPGWIPIAVSVTGWILLILFSFAMGREFAGWVPARFGRFATVLTATVAPPAIGTPLLVLLYWPLPRALIGSMLAGSSFWFPAIAGAAFATPRHCPVRALASFSWLDGAITIAAVAMIRTFAAGVRLTH